MQRAIAAIFDEAEEFCEELVVTGGDAPSRARRQNRQEADRKGSSHRRINYIRRKKSCEIFVIGNKYELIRKPEDARLPAASANRCWAEGKTIAQR